MLDNKKVKKKTVDRQLQEQRRKIIEYYFKVLKKVVCVIKYLNKRGLTFRSHEERWSSPNNGKFMAAIEIIAMFDPFLHEQLKKCKNKK